jgi:hypothetical protein
MDCCALSVAPDLLVASHFSGRIVVYQASVRLGQVCVTILYLLILMFRFMSDNNSLHGHVLPESTLHSDTLP